MPTTDTAWPDGTPCWIDYSAADLDAARSFYRSVFGWTYSGGGEEYGGYDNALTAGRHAAGIYPRMDDSQPPRWLTYFATSDAAAATQRVTAAGGTVIAPPMAVGGLGTMAVAVGPQGEPFGLWQAGDHVGVRIFNEPGSLVWNEAAVADPDAAREFYAAVFGFHYDAVEGAPAYTTFATGDRPLGGLGALASSAAAGWMACFSVASTDAAVAAVEAGGGKVTTTPVDMPAGRYAVVEDPWGAPFSVMQAPTG